MRPSMLKPADWPAGITLVLTDKRTFPVMAEETLAEGYLFSLSDFRDDAVITLFPPERLRLERVIDQGRHALCRHAASTLLMVATKHLRPLED